MNMAGKSEGNFDRVASQLDEMQLALREAGLDGWLLYDLHARNAVTASLLGRGDLTRRFFVLIPADGEPLAIIHGIEEAPWAAWPWQRQRYVGWKQLEERLAAALAGRRRVAMEISPGDAVPALDLVPSGVVQLVEATGVEVVSSGDLITRFYARWSEAGLASHQRASVVLADVAREALEYLGREVEAGRTVTEGELLDRVLRRLAERGCGAGADSIVANGVHAADPHYRPHGSTTAFRPGDVVLLDLWAKETDDSIYADQTWMGYLGATVPDRVAELFAVIRDARDAAVAFLRQQWQAGRPLSGGEVDDVARAIVRERGYGDHFIHRTGHSIDQDTHGMGPNIDNLETREGRLLIPGVGFSIEPGIYLAGDVGLRTEINVYISEDGPIVTTPGPQSEVAALMTS
jgi:Xaa-Pro dipeptidase